MELMAARWDAEDPSGSGYQSVMNLNSAPKLAPRGRLPAAGKADG